MNRYPDFPFPVFPGTEFSFNDYEAIQVFLRLFWGIMMTVLVLSLLIGVLYLVFMGLGLSRMAKRKGIPNGWLGFIPIVNLYTLGKVSATNERKRPEIALLILGVLSALFSVISLLSLVPLVDIIFQASLAAPRGGFDIDNFSERLVSITLMGAVTFIITVGVSIALMVLMFIALHRVYKQFSPDNANVMTVFSVLSYALLAIPIHPFMLFAIRNNEIWPYGKPPYGYNGAPYPPNVPKYDPGSANNPPPYAQGEGQPAPSLKPPAQGFTTEYEASSRGYTEPLEPPAQGYATSLDTPSEKAQEPPEGE